MGIGSRSKLVLLAVLLINSCGKQHKEYFLSQGKIFHTSYHIKYEYTREINDEIQAALNRFDLSLNPFNQQSIISKVNRNESVIVDDWFAAVFDKAQEVSSNSQGAFDITCAPLVNLWGFGFSNQDTVSTSTIDSLKNLVGYQKICLKNRRIIKDDPRILLNASAIAKGYACDVIASLLDSHHIENYLVEIGGEIHAKGKNAQGVCWKVEIPKPQDDKIGFNKKRQEVILVCNNSMATSGNYRNYYVKDGKKYAHTIDPRTGYPAEQNILSATVIASDCMTADAYATAFMVLGLDEAGKLGDRIRNLAYYFVYADEKGNHQVKMSTNMEEYIKQGN